MKEQETQWETEYEKQSELWQNRVVFFSRLAQNMTSPIKHMLELTAAAGTNVYDAEKVLDCMNQVNIRCRELLKTVEALQELSLAAGNQTELQEDRFNISSQLQYLLNMIRVQAAGGNKRVVVSQVHLMHEEVLGDSRRLELLLWDIWSYLLDCIPEGEHLELRFQEMDERTEKACYCITVRGRSQLELISRLKVLENLSLNNQQWMQEPEEYLKVCSARQMVELMGGGLEMKWLEEQQWQVRIRLSLRYEKTQWLLTKDLEGKRLLVVDDKELCGKCCQMVIEDLGMHSDYVAAGKEALELLEQQKYFAVLLDWHMPEMDGLELTREIRRLKQDIPIILMSEQDWEGIEYQARRAGVTSCMLKPLFPSELTACLQQYTEFA